MREQCGPRAADEPTLLDRDERFGRSDRGFQHRRVIDLPVTTLPRIGRRQYRLGLARDEGALAQGDADIALAPEAAEPGYAMNEAWLAAVTLGRCRAISARAWRGGVATRNMFSFAQNASALRSAPVAIARSTDDLLQGRKADQGRQSACDSP